MKEIIKNSLIEYQVINIKKNIPVLEYLKRTNNKFKLQRVTNEEFQLLKTTDNLVELESRDYIAGYSKELTGYNFGASGGLKISDPDLKIRGSFIIQNKKIIYDASYPFYKEKDSYVYDGATYYTTMSMREILIEELKRKRKYLIYLGEKVNKETYRYEELFEYITKEELIDYATYPEKGELAFCRRRYF